MKRTQSLLAAIAVFIIVITAAACGTSPATPTGTAIPTETAPTATATTPPSPTSTPQPTVSATASPTASPSATTQPTPGGDDIAAAVQTVLDYYTAINDQRFQDAYGFWADNGAASGQSYDQFSGGFASTVQTTILVDNVLEEGTGGSRTVSIGLRLLSVVNEASSKQSVQRYQGNIVLQPVSNQWKLKEGNLSPQTPAAEAAPEDVSGPDVVIRSYFDAINGRNYAKAYTYWNNLGGASGQTFAKFRGGFRNTASVTIELGEAQQEGAAGSVYATMPVTITATQTDGTTQRFEGTYTARRANVPPFEQFGWRIETADVTKTP